jgi:hypothetical protein
METSLRFDSVQKRLHLFAKENFVSDDNVVLTLNGSLCTRTGSVLGKVRPSFLPFPLGPVERGDATAGLQSECMLGLAAARLAGSVHSVRCGAGDDAARRRVATNKTIRAIA